MSEVPVAYNPVLREQLIELPLSLPGSRHIITYPALDECIGDIALIEGRNKSIGSNHFAKMPVFRPSGTNRIRKHYPACGYQSRWKPPASGYNYRSAA
jgi:hypothetical protein